ncbi:MAG: SRPBCC family protein [Roseivivax sp.]|nr:SRPBCC family protein [Roseivivax sp.]
MKFSAKEDIAAPIASVFAVLEDFDVVERAAMRRGVEVSRQDSDSGAAQGTHWTARFDFRGKPRESSIALSSVSAPETLVFDATTGGLGSQVQLDLVALNPALTRLSMTAELKPHTLAARLMVQSLRLAKGSVEKRFRARFGDAARLIEARAKGLS